jgi:small subunit ribosomal protein S6
MPYYETVFIARQDLSPAQVEDLTKLFTGFITAGGGKILKTESWGLRQLAYRINKNRKGHYVLIESETAPAALIEMERNIRLNEDVLRYMTLRLDEPTKGPSAILGGDRSNDNDTATTEKDAA